MPDKYDPKFSVRPSGDRKPPNPGAEADDPLFELARLVSGKGFEAASARSSDRAAPAPRAPLPSETELARDLESELLNELQASFSMLQEPIASAMQPSSTPPPAAPPAPAPPPSMTIAPPQAEPPAPPARPVARQPKRVERPLPVAPPEPRVDRTEQRLERQQARLERLQRHERAQAAAAAQLPGDRVPSFRPAAQPNDLSNLQFRPTNAPAPPLPPATRSIEPPAKADSPRWMPRTERRADAPLPRYAPPRAAAPPPRQDSDAIPNDDETFDESLILQDEGYFDDEEQAENFDLVPGYGDEELLPPFPEEELAALQPKRAGRGIVMIAALFAVVVIGGAAAILLRSGTASSSPPPVIAADATPTKVLPETGQAVEDDSQAKLIYDRVDPGEEAADSQLAAQSNDPISDVSAEDEGSSNPISRVILPGGPGIDSVADGGPPDQVADTSEDNAGSGSGIKPIGPKKVRTVVVRPDGTIVSSEALPADGSVDDATAATATVPPAAPDASPMSLQPTDEVASVPPPAPASTSDTAELEAAAQQGGDIAARESAGGDIALRESTEPLPLSGTDTEAAPAEAVATPEPPVKPARKPTPKPAPATAAAESEPVELTPAPPRARPAEQQTAALVPAGALLVQVSSQRSEDAAKTTFRDLQRRFPQILGRYEANIQRADLGARGVYYRVRVGPFAGGDAQKVCDALKGAGGDCILAPR
jgi:hypothetical protein